MAIKFQEGKKYKLSSNHLDMEFFVSTINREANEVYVKIVSPYSDHQGFVLSSLEENEFLKEL